MENIIVEIENLIEEEQYQQALDLCLKNIETNPDNVKLLCLITKAKAYLEYPTEEIIDNCSKIIKLDPNNVEAYLERINHEICRDKFEEAITDCNKVIELDPYTADNYLLRVELKLHLAWKLENNIKLNSNLNNNTDRIKLYEDIIADCNRALDLDNDSTHTADAYSNMGFAKYNLGQYQEAIFDYNRAIELKPYNTGALFCQKKQAQQELNKLKIKAFINKIFPFLR